MRKHTATTSLAILFLISCESCLANPEPKVRDKIFLGYVSGEQKEINYSLYSHLCHAFVVAEKDGTLIPQEKVPNDQLAREAHREGVKVLLSLGGWGWDENFASMSLDPHAEDRYVAAVIKLIEDYDYDGIDLDWEYPDTHIEIVGFERLARRFRQLLDELGSKKCRPMLLTMAAAAHPTTLEWLSNEFLLETIDWINVMTYDYCGSWATFAGHHAPLYASSKMPKDDVSSVEITINYLLKQRSFPADRIVLGLPLYGRAFAVRETYASTVKAPKPNSDSANYKLIDQLINQHHWVRRWDDETKNPWIFSPDGSEIIGYDDRESIAIKADWAANQGLRGVFFWQIDADRMPDGSNPLQESARRTLYQKEVP